MSDTTQRGLEPDTPDTVLAGEYVLRLLSPAEERAVEDRMATSGGLRAMVVRWQEDFAALAETIAAVTPPRRLRSRIEGFVRAEDAARDVARPPRRFSAGRFLGGALGGLAVAALALAALFVALPPREMPGEGPVYTASLTGDAPPFEVVARYDAGAGRLTLDRVVGDAPPAGRVLQLWLLPEGASAPTSLGLVPDDVDVSLDLPEEIGASIPNGLLEISQEPDGGSPEAGPTGPVLGIGRVGGADGGSLP